LTGRRISFGWQRTGGEKNGGKKRGNQIQGYLGGNDQPAGNQVERRIGKVGEGG